jgi:hypothetical protein
MKCLFCRADMGKNDLLPELPAGSRFAFDPANARLWIVCPKCSRWNMAALDESERRTAVARLESFYTATPRAELHGIGVADLEGRASLVRVGPGTWSQYSAWRYANRIRRRYLDQIISSVLVLVVIFLILSPSGEVVFGSWWAIAAIYVWLGGYLWKYALRPVFHMRDEQGKRRAVRLHHLKQASVSVKDSGWRLLLRRDRGVSSLAGLDAIRALGRLLPHWNGRGHSESQLAEALDIIERAGGPAQLFATRLTPAWLGAGTHKLADLPPSFVLALQIAAQEESELRALRGELASVKLELEDAAATAHIAEELAR